MFILEVKYGFDLPILGIWVTWKRWKISEEKLREKLDELMPSLRIFKSIDVRVASPLDIFGLEKTRGRTR